MPELEPVCDHGCTAVTGLCLQQPSPASLLPLIVELRYTVEKYKRRQSRALISSRTLKRNANSQNHFIAKYLAYTTVISELEDILERHTNE